MSSAGSFEPKNRHQTAVGCFLSSYFFTTWNARSDSFAITLFLTFLYPSSLRAISIYFLTTLISSMVLAPFAGSIIDYCPRHRLVSVSLWCQKWSIALSALILLAKLGFSFENRLGLDLEEQEPTDDWYFISTVANGSVLTIFNNISRIAIERDWATCISKNSEGSIPLARLNSRLRLIDLVCDLVAPLVISFIASIWNIQIAMVFVISTSCISSFLENLLMNLVYNHFTALAKKEPNVSLADLSSREVETIWQKWKRIWKMHIVMTCISLSMLYLTVLNLSSVMISFLIFKKLSLFAISVIRGVSVLFGISSAITFEPLIRRFGIVHVGLLAIWYQVTALFISILSIHLSWTGHLDFTSYMAIFLTTLCLSRWGLWTFDMAQQQLLQEYIPASDLGFVSGVEISLQNIFTITVYFITAIYHKPEQFEWVPMHVSFVSVLMGGLIFTYYYIYYRNEGLGLGFEQEPLLGVDET